jgi:hypothetical protein
MFYGKFGINSYAHIWLYYHLPFHPHLPSHDQALSLGPAFDHAPFSEQ